jgi:hypothetical protein
MLNTMQLNFNLETKEVKSKSSADVVDCETVFLKSNNQLYVKIEK